MKKDTKHTRADIVNQSLAYIYKYIDTNINLEELARLNSVSKYHFHRIFKEETGENLFDRISIIRLQKAANLLITNRYSTISEIALMCGYASHSSFIKAFKKRFTYTPTQWRKGSFRNFSKDILNLDENFEKSFEDINPTITFVKKRFCAYIRHKGCDLDLVNKTWERLLAFAYERHLENSVQIGFYHDNPIITNSKEWTYIAAIEVDANFVPTNSISKVEVPKSTCAIFHYKGVYGDIGRLMAYIYHYWLPNSGYEAKTVPPYAIYHTNHCLKGNEEFEIDFFLPISVV